MALIRTCDKCGEPIDREGPLGERSLVQAMASLDETLPSGGGIPKDYHRACARTVTVAEVWARDGLVEL